MVGIFFFNLIVTLSYEDVYFWSLEDIGIFGFLRKDNLLKCLGG